VVTLGLPDPCAQRLDRTTDLFRDRLDGHPLRRIVGLLVENQSAPPVPEFRGTAS
jgi:hypothetical protein